MTNRIHFVHRDEVPEIRLFLITGGVVSVANQFSIKLYCLQCKQLQFVLFGRAVCQLAN